MKPGPSAAPTLEVQLERVEADGRVSVHVDQLAVEEPLEVRLEDRPFAVLMRTPGHDLDLVAGFLLSEGLIEDADDLAAMQPCGDPHRGGVENLVRVRFASGTPRAVDAALSATRTLRASGACGVCGRDTIDDLLARLRPLSPRPWPDPGHLATLPDRLRAAQTLFDVTGGVHGAALFAADGTLLVVREDVGRHNAVDKVLGARLRAGHVPDEARDEVLVVSSRAGFEIVQKAVAGRVPVVVAVGAATHLADALARAANLRLHAFVRPRGMNRHA